MSGVPLSPQMLGYKSGVGQYYKPSGELNPAALVAAFLVGSVAAVVLAVPYVYAIKYIPIVKLNAICCGAFGAAVGAVPAAVLKRMKVRSLPAGLLVCGLVGVVGLYAAWVVWEAVVLNGVDGAPSVATLATHPVMVARLGQVINEVGTWGMGHSYATGPAKPEMTKGTELAVIWAIEALTIVLTPLLVGRSTLRSVPFCDACDAWCNTKGLVRSTALTDPKDLRQRLEGGDFAYVATLPPPAAGGGLEFTRHSCGKCGKMNTLTVTRKVIARNKKGKVVKNESKVIVDKLLVTTDDLKRLVPVTPAVNAAAARPPAV